MTPAETLLTIRNRLRRLVALGVLHDTEAQVMLGRAAEAGREAWRAMEPER